MVSKIIFDQELIIKSKILSNCRKNEHLGNLATSDGCVKEVKRKIVLLKIAFRNVENLMTDTKLKMQTRRFLKWFVWPVLLYGWETWPWREPNERRLEANEM